ncbi:aspartate kinase [Peribacillus sp. SCS-26]|uniref:aspartate kinase n=1 Tax=Paraperibacillus marinus TaxID=3115295 RepID=UPI003906520A
MKVVKFGGSSLASGEQFKKVCSIIASDPERRLIVVSAPGKRSREDLKVTDLLIASAGFFLKNGRVDEILYEEIVQRYKDISDCLNLDAEVIEEISTDIRKRIENRELKADQYLDLVKAGGEDNCARLLAAYLRQQGLESSYQNPLGAGLFVSAEPGNAQVLDESYGNLASLADREGISVFPGFFGYTKNGCVATFSRSGSDITGSILSNAVRAELYENFTDVDAVYSVSPGTVDGPKEISMLTYREMRELSYAGFSVLHDEALIPAFRAGIPVNIKNTNNPDAPGTLIVNSRKKSNGPVVGIASADGFCSIYVSKYLMNRELGFGRRLLYILEEFHLSYEHSPSGIDDISVIIKQDGFSRELEGTIINRIYDDLGADEVKVEKDISLIMIVGEGMRHNVGTTARASMALAKAGVNIEMINQGSSEVSMMFGVKQLDEKKAVKSLYEEFFVSVPV